MDGIYTKDCISINFSEGKKTSNEAVQIAKDGGISNIKIMEASGAAFVLKEIGSATTSGTQGNLYPAMDTESEIKQAVTAMTDNESDISNRITEDDSEALEEDGMTLERYNSERLERLLEARKAMAELMEKGIEGVKRSVREAKQSAEKTGKKLAIEKESDSRFVRIAEHLAEANLPITENNINRIAKAMDLAGEARSMTEASFSYLIDNRLEPTIENCYRAAHSGKGGKRIVTDEVFNELKPYIEKTAAEAGIEVNERLTASAKNLLENGLNVTAKNLIYSEELQELKNAVDTGLLTEDALLEGTVETLKNRQDPVNTNLYIVIKREEIRFSLMQPNLTRMKELGIEPDLEGIKGRIEALKQEEKAAAKAELAGLTEDEEPLRQFEETLTAIETVGAVRERVTVATFERRKNIALKELAAAAYEASATEIRPDLGDSIKKAFEGVDELLQSMELDVTKENRNAVRMLGYASMQITEDSINEMKYYASQIDTLVNGLKPQTVAELIKREVNPLESTILELSRQVSAINEELGQTPDERYSEYLVKLERSRDITPEQRESYIGIYRMLYQIEKTDGAAISALVKSGREFTLKNLLTEVRTGKHRRIDKNVNDELGAADAVFGEEASIDEQIYTAYNANSLERVSRKATPERLNLLERETAAEKPFTELKMDVLADRLEELPEGEEDYEYRSERLEEMRRILDNSETEKKFLKNFEIEDTVFNLQAAGQMLSGTNAFAEIEKLRREKAEELSNDSEEAKLSTEELPDTEAELMEKHEKLTGTAESIMEQIYLEAELTGNEAMTLRNLGHIVELSAKLSKREYFDIPLEDENGITNLKLTLVHDGEKQGRFLISIQEYGIRAEGTLTGDKLSVLVSADGKEAFEAVKRDRSGLSERLSSVGFEEPEIYVENGRGRSLYLNETGTERAKTVQLYTAAKETVLFLRTAYKQQGDNI